MFPWRFAASCTISTRHMGRRLWITLEKYPAKMVKEKIKDNDSDLVLVEDPTLCNVSMLWTAKLCKIIAINKKKIETAIID